MLFTAIDEGVREHLRVSMMTEGSILQMIVNLWVTNQGFSFVSAFIEYYKQDKKAFCNVQKHYGRQSNG